MADPTGPFISHTQLFGLLDCGAIFVCLIVIDTFNLACFTFIAQTGQVSKAAVYSSLNATWIIIIELFQAQHRRWIWFYIVAIYAGYTLI
jgi:hypothetical protein